MKQKIPPASPPPQRVSKQEGGVVPLAKEPLAKPEVTLTKGSSRGPRGKKALLTFMVAASICVVAAWAVFTIKPSWLAEFKGRLPFTGASINKRSPARYPSRPVFKVVQPQRTNPLPPATPPQVADRLGRPQTIPAGISPSTPPSAYPITRLQVAPPGATGTPPAMPPSSTYPGTRPEVTMPNAPGIAPTMPPSLAKGPPSAASPFPGEVQRPSAVSSSGQGATTGFSPSKKEDSESDEYLEIATLYAQKGKYRKAEELFQKVAKENPSSARAHNNLGVVRLKQEKYDMAEREFKEALRLDPAFVLPYYNLACLYSRKGVDVDALIYLKKALKRDERVKQWVKGDKDFDKLRSDVVFQELVGGSASKKEATQIKEEIQKQGGAQKQDDVRKQEGSLKKKEESLKQETQTQEKALKTGPQKKEEIPPQSGPLKQVAPKQEEIQKQEGIQGNTSDGAPHAQGQTGGAQNQIKTDGGEQNQNGTQGPQGGAVQ
jgi:tetratricopeptide (TPR) repeat protein